MDTNMYPKVENNGYSLPHMEILKKIIKATIISPYIENEKPINLLIIAKPESGKTTVMKAYRMNKGIAYITDCTAYGISRDILPKIVSGEIKTIMIPDLLTPLSKSTKTRQTFIAFLNNLIEEGIAKITSYATVWDKEVKANLITAVTDEAIRDGRREWAKMGFLSRFIIFSYSYSIRQVLGILQYYSGEQFDLEPSIKMKMPNRGFKVELSGELAQELNPLAMKIGEQFNIYGIRAKINLRALLKALSYLNGRKEVGKEDYGELLELVEFMNFRYNPIR